MAQQENTMSPSMVYYNLLKQGVPPSEAFNRAFPNGLPKKPTPQELAKEQQKAALGQIGGMGAALLGGYYGLKALGLTGAKAGAGTALSTVGTGATAGTVPAATLAVPELTAVAPGAAGAAGSSIAAPTILSASHIPGAAAAGAAAPTGILTGASPALYFGAPAAFLGGMSIAAPSIVKGGRKLALALGIGDKRPEREYNPEIQAMSKNLNLQLPGISGMDPDTRKAILDKFFQSGALRLPGRKGMDEQALELSTEGSSMLIPNLTLDDRIAAHEKYGRWNRALPMGEILDMMKKSPTYNTNNPKMQAMYDAYNMYQQASQGQRFPSPGTYVEPRGPLPPGSLSSAQPNSSPGGTYVEPRGPTVGSMGGAIQGGTGGGMAGAIQGGPGGGGFSPLVANQQYTPAPQPQRGSSLLKALQGSPALNRVLGNNNFTEADVQKAIEMMRRKGR
jgi:hypothetical protein